MSPVHRSLHSIRNVQPSVAELSSCPHVVAPTALASDALTPGVQRGLLSLLGLGTVLVLMWIPALCLAQYEIGPEDVIRISVWGEPSLGTEAPVRPDGMITFAPLGEIKAAGLTPAQLGSSLTTQLAEYIKTSPQVNVTVVAFNSWKLYILGAVGRPGKYGFPGSPSLLEALSSAGSTSANADLQRIRIIPEDAARMSQEVNLQQFLDGNLVEPLPKPHVGDTIYVPRMEPADDPLLREQPTPGTEATTTPVPQTGPSPAFTINILGHVPQRGPLVFEAQPSLVDVLSQAGGVVDSFAYREIRVIRTASLGEVIPVDMAGYLKTGDVSLLPHLQDGDAIYVPEVVPSQKAKKTSVILLGQVLTPGEIPVAGPIHPMDALALAGGASPLADPSRTRVIREVPDGLLSRDVNLDVLQEDLLAPDILFQPGDIVIVPQRYSAADTGATIVRGTLRVLRDILFVYSTYRVLAP